MPLTTAFDLVFAAGIVVAVARARRRGASVPAASALRIALVALELVGAVAAWVAFALEHDHERELAVARRA